MKQLVLSLSLFTILGTAFGQAKKPEVKPFSYSANETEANRIFVLMNQLKEVVKKSSTPYNEGVVIQNNADTVIMGIQAQYSAWIASQKKDTTGKK